MIFFKPLLVLRVPALLSGAGGGSGGGGGAVDGQLISSTPSLEKTRTGDVSRARTRGSLGVSARLSPVRLIFATDPLSRPAFSH